MLYDFIVDNFSAACCKLTTGKHFSSAILRRNSVYKNKNKEQKQLKIYDIEMKEMIDSLLYSLYLSSIWGVITVKKWSRQQQRGKRIVNLRTALMDILYVAECWSCDIVFSVETQGWLLLACCVFY